MATARRAGQISVKYQPYRDGVGSAVNGIDR
jgi:hypothetical protein